MWVLNVCAWGIFERLSWQTDVWFLLWWNNFEVARQDSLTGFSVRPVQFCIFRSQIRHAYVDGNLCFQQKSDKYIDWTNYHSRIFLGKRLEGLWDSNIFWVSDVLRQDPRIPTENMYAPGSAAGASSMNKVGFQTRQKSRSLYTATLHGDHGGKAPNSLVRASMDSSSSKVRSKCWAPSLTYPKASQTSGLHLFLLVWIRFGDSAEVQSTWKQQREAVDKS